MLPILKLSSSMMAKGGERAEKDPGVPETGLPMATPLSPGLLVIDISSGHSDEKSEGSEKEEDQGSDGKIGPSERQRVEGRAKFVLPPGFLDPLPHLTSSKAPNLRGEMKKLEHAHWDDIRRHFLIKLLQDYNEPRWKRKNNFMTEAWKRITEDFNRRFPDTNLSKSQIQCQLCKMKENYRDLNRLLELKGFEWDYTNNVVQGSEDAWQTLLHTNKDAKRWHKKPWPYYSIFQEIFEGKCAPEKQSSATKEHKERGMELESPPSSQEEYLRLNSDQETEEVDESHIFYSSSPMTQPPPPQTPLTAEKEQQQRPSQAPSGTSSSRDKSTKRREKTDVCIQGPERKIPKNEGEFSIKMCLKAFYTLDGFAKEEIVKVGKVFKRCENREIFMSLRDEDKEFWLRGEVDNL